MKYKQSGQLRTIVMGVLVGFAGMLMSCVKAKDPYNPADDNTDRMGTVTLSSLGREGDFIVVEPQSSTTKADDGAVPDVSTFRVAILTSDGENVVHNNTTGADYKWETFAEIDGQMITIPSGKYKFEAASHAEEPSAEWETPYYYGVQDFSVAPGAAENVDLVCKLANIKVTVAFEQEFLDNVDNPLVQVYFDYTDPETAEKVYDVLEFTPTEDRAGYFKVPADGNLYVKVTGTRKADNQPLGNGAGYTEIISNAAAMQWHKVTVGYQETGAVLPSIDIDYSTIDSEHTIEIPDGDGVIDGGSNNDNWEDGDDGDGGGTTQTLEIVGANYNGSPFDISQQLEVSASVDNEIDVRFDASEGIDQLYVTINSEALATLLPGLGLENGVPFDIANLPDDSERPEGVDESAWWVNMFADPAIGILDPEVPIKGKTTHTFKVGGLMSMLAMVANPSVNGAAVHKFGLKMVDSKGNVKEATLAINLSE